MTVVFASLIVLAGLAAAYRSGARQDLFGLMFVNYFIWHQFAPALAGDQVFWATDRQIGFETQAWAWALFFFLSGIVLSARASRHGGPTIGPGRTFTPLDKVIFLLAALALGSYAANVGLLNYVLAYSINCGNCIASADFETFFLRAVPRYVIWYYVIVWVAAPTRTGLAKTLRIAVGIVIGLLVFPPTGATRYQYLGYASSLVLLAMPRSPRSFSLVYLAYPLALYFPVGAISFLRAGLTLPDRLASFVNSPDFSDFEVLRVALWYAGTEGYQNGVITLSSLMPVPRSIFALKWDGSGFTLFDQGYLTFTNVGFSPFTELILDFGVFAVFLWPLLFLFIRGWFRGHSIVFVGLLPILMRGSLLSFAAFVLTVYAFQIFDASKRITLRPTGRPRPVALP